MKRKILLLCGILALSGCATKDYALYAETQQKIAQANAMAETARYAALAEIAKSGDTASRVAAVMSLNMGGNGQSVKPQQHVVPPKSWSDTALQWTGILLPSLTQIYGINANRQVAITQSNNQTAIAKSTNDTFATMNTNMGTSNTAIANSGLTAATTIANSGFAATTEVAKLGITGVVTTSANGLTATTNVANAGITGVGNIGASGLTAATTISANANTAVTNVSNAANASIQTLSTQIPNLQPNQTTTTNTSTNNTTTNNNLTCLSGTTLINGSCQ